MRLAALLALLFSAAGADRSDVTPFWQVPETLVPQIVKGVTAALGARPWQVFLVANFSSVSCGGALISSTAVLTAAHCIFRARNCRVYVGGVDNRWRERSEQVLVAKRTMTHERYDPKTLTFDLGLVLLSRPAVLNTFVRPIRLPSDSDVRSTYSGRTGSICGYGRTSANGTYSRYQTCVNLTITTNYACSRFFRRGLVQSHTLCTTASTKSPCQGDSGGPLVVKEADGQPTLVGVFSFTAAQGCDGYPAGFMRTTSFLPWIQQNAKIPPRTAK